MKKVYLAGQSNEYENNWKEDIKKIPDFEFFDWEIHSDQTSPDTYFPDDMRAIFNADILIANPGVVSSEATWIEIGAFYGNNVKKYGDFCKNLIVIWSENRNPKWSIDFVKKTGIVVTSPEKAVIELNKLK